VLQEAADPTVPLLERLRFLAIFSNNRDEFFRVRVASQKRLLALKKKDRSKLEEDPAEVLEQIQKVVISQENEFELLYHELIKLLEQENIYIVDESKLNTKQEQFVSEYFHEQIRPTLVPILIGQRDSFPWLKNDAIYLAVQLEGIEEEIKIEYAFIEIPSNILPRFVQIPSEGNQKFIIILEDIIRHFLDEIFSFFKYKKIKAYTIKITRDAELDIDDDFNKSFIDKISKSLKNRRVGDPVRFVHDQKIPADFLNFIAKKLGLKSDENIIPGGRYHNFRDFIDFPKVASKKFYYKNLEPLEHIHLRNSRSVMEAIEKQDILLNYPFQSFNYLIDFLREAAINPNVTSIKINLYRVAKNSKIINALVNAVKNGKEVTAIVELQARFDEENNIRWSKALQEEGVKVIFGIQGLKVHSKLILVTKKIKAKVVQYAHVGTGNFHERTARIYTDMSLLTCDKRITNEVVKVFDFFQNPYKIKRYSHLIISPFHTRNRFVSLINKEMRNVKKGKEGRIILKLNNLVDRDLIDKLYAASQAGVKVDLIIRGICSLVPGVKGVSDNIRGISIVDRFLEHSRVAYFLNDGDPEIFISSADWMIRNLDRRVEVSVPIYDKKIKKLITNLLNIQLEDNEKARIISGDMKNKYVGSEKKVVRSQIKTYQYFKNKLIEADNHTEV
jgi:polyphosphate kinase